MSNINKIMWQAANFAWSMVVIVLCVVGVNAAFGFESFLGAITIAGTVLYVILGRAAIDKAFFAKEIK